MATPPPKAKKSGNEPSGARVVLLLFILALSVFWFKRTFFDEPVAPRPVAVEEKPAPVPAPEPETAAPKPEPVQAGNVNVKAAPTPAPAAVPAPDPNAMPPQSQEQFVAEFKKCFPDRAQPSSQSDFVNSMINSADVEERETNSEEIHVNDGQKEWTISIVTRGVNKEVRTYVTDEKGQANMENREFENPAEAEDSKREFLHKGRILKQQRKESLLYVDGMHGDIDWKDDKPESVSFFRANGSFFCMRGSCQCRTNARQF